MVTIEVLCTLGLLDVMERWYVNAGSCVRVYTYVIPWRPGTVETGYHGNHLPWRPTIVLSVLKPSY